MSQSGAEGAHGNDIWRPEAIRRRAGCTSPLNALINAKESVLYADSDGVLLDCNDPLPSEAVGFGKLLPLILGALQSDIGADINAISDAWTTLLLVKKNAAHLACYRRAKGIFPSCAKRAAFIKAISRFAYIFIRSHIFSVIPQGIWDQYEGRGCALASQMCDVLWKCFEEHRLAPSDAASLCAAYVNMLEFAAQREAGGVWRRDSSCGWQVDAGGEWSTVVDQGLKRIVCQMIFCRIETVWKRRAVYFPAHLIRKAWV